MSSNDMPMWRTPNIRKAGISLAAITITSVILWLILLSPILLRQIGQHKGFDWARLSNIGQTYGAASAILSGIALIGISASLIIQARQARAERVRIVRERHMELLRVVLDNPRTYATVIGSRSPSTAEGARQFFFCTMWMNYARMGYEMRVINERAIRRELLSSAFGSEPMRKWWSTAGNYWTSGFGLSRRERHFFRIAHEEYHNAVARHPTPIQRNIEDSRPENPSRKTQGQWRIPTSIALGIVIGIFARSNWWPTPDSQRLR